MNFFLQSGGLLQAPHWMRSRCPAVLVIAVLASGCVTDALDRAPAAHDRPWRPVAGSVPNYASTAAFHTDAAVHGFSIPVIPQLDALAPGPQIEPDGPLNLTALIDIAQRENPQTRGAWNRARQAALAVGIAEATFLPMLSANVIAGGQSTSVPSPLVVNGRSTIDTNVRGVVPALTLEWLLFDFGQRDAILDEAQQLSFAANVLFNATHQKVIRDVTDQYYQYHTARLRVGLTKQALSNHWQVALAAKERMDGGVATSVELAVARQGVAQAKLHRVNAEGVERNAYLGLLDAVGLPPTSRLVIADQPRRQLPKPADRMTDEALHQALIRRPDIAASYAAIKAAEAGVKAAEAEFMPKVYLGAVAAKSHSNFDIRGLPGLSQRATTGGVLLGVTIPIYDGGLRSARLSQERIHVQEAKDTLRSRQYDALREMVAAETLLRSALQSYQAASELVQSANTVYDAALQSYREGMGTITIATEAATGLLEARQARADAYGASLLAAADLAFSLGRMTSARDNWLSPNDMGLQHNS